MILPLFLNYQILILGKLFIWENMVENIFFGKGKVTWHEIRQGIPQWSLIISISEAHFSAIFIPSAPIGFYRALKVEIKSAKLFAQFWRKKYLHLFGFSLSIFRVCPRFKNCWFFFASEADRAFQNCTFFQKFAHSSGFLTHT